MAPIDREIPQRELRNDVSAVLEQVAAGARFRVTVRGRPVADLVPVFLESRFVRREELQALLKRASLDAGFAADVESVVGGTVDEL